ncbi:adenylate cyclase [Thermoclostridium stercorarium subsp. thermolacticum DSM 2910]|jgi:Amt family ammonium transporter|uniref:Adenylate cyclase n=3 Tax=Thermoclostridium stercorarium TaxID=1510 RepID=A0A1B1YLE9_THEST|nr:ammonium transporter [Thermoclostridium stercorarium]ANW99074.1 adenylate cyclase [Thermoclostridium stercorarium subsp. thermolacticum DSM 2910]ANX01609.1 adenylate cyclase [Thermoclostridium stercorarium subsp. leptospartum DSM 9219]
MDITMFVDTLWVVFAGILVFFMNLGFAAVESGFARSKNTVNILSKNFIVFAVSSLGFMLLGWGLMFGGDNPFIGTQNLFILNNSSLDFYKDTLTPNVPFWAKFFFQLVFCGTAATIVSGAVAERIKYISFILFSFILTLVIYPIVGHWIWGGGWLAKLGFMDFAGDTVVHSVGGWAALAGAIILGPRCDKYDKNGKPKAIPGHNMSLAVIGLFILWLGWFGFNPGSTMSFQNPADVAHIVLTTNTSAIAAVLTATATSWIFIGKPDLGMTINGCLAGLVGITGSCAYVSVASSLLIGAIAGVLVVFSVLFFDRVKVDDPVGATSVHLVCGVFGTLCVGLFAQEGVTSLSTVNGLFFGGGLKLFGIELLGIIAVGAFVFVSTSLVWLILKETVGIRVSLEEEIQGLDIGEHGNTAYPDFAIVAPIMASVNGTSYDEQIAGIQAAVSKPASDVVSPDVAIPVVDKSRPGAKITRITVITNQEKFPKLQSDLDKIGITGLTVTNVLGYGMQKGYTEYYRGVPVKTRLLPKVKVDIVVCKIPTETVINTIKKSLYTGNVGDGKIFVYDVENVIKIRTGEEGYDALQDEDKE